jgi:hypothetical protein
LCAFVAAARAVVQETVPVTNLELAGWLVLPEVQRTDYFERWPLLAVSEAMHESRRDHGPIDHAIDREPVDRETIEDEPLEDELVDHEPVDDEPEHQ